MEPMEPKSSLSSKPLAGMIVILVVALFVGGWLLIDSTRSDLQLQIDALSAQVNGRQMLLGRTQAAAPAPAVTAWNSYDSGKYRFEYPSGWNMMSQPKGSAYAVQFLDANGKPVAKYGCSPDFSPGVPSGYSLEESKRSLVVDPSTSYDFTLTNAMPMMGNMMQKPYSSIWASEEDVKNDTPCYLYTDQPLPDDMLMHMWRSFIIAK